LTPANGAAIPGSRPPPPAGGFERFNVVDSVFAEFGIRDPAALDTELARIRTEHNTVRLHASIGYVTPDDEHPAIIHPTSS
jgi:hypothetical protein